MVKATKIREDLERGSNLKNRNEDSTTPYFIIVVGVLIIVLLVHFGANAQLALMIILLQGISIQYLVSSNGRRIIKRLDSQKENYPKISSYIEIKEKLSYSIFWSEEDNCYLASVKEYPLLKTHGDSPEKALNELVFVIKAVIIEEESKKEIKK